MKHVLYLQCPSEINYKNHRTGDNDLEPAGNNTDIGFFQHTTLAVDTNGNFPLGVSCVHIWNHSFNKQDKNQRKHIQQPIEENESYRWISSW